jgi:predicted RNase H-like nuclease
VRALGIDLAWDHTPREGQQPRKKKNWTGLCVVEGDRVLDSAMARTNDEIDAWIKGWIRPDDEVVAGIDAPLIVPNLTRRRPCEAVFCEAFRQREAGVYPANLSLPAFCGGIRGADLAARLGLSLDPAACLASPTRAALEVYPHSAIVALFGLPRTLKYKRKHPPDVRNPAFHQLLGYMRQLAELDPPLDVTSSPRWKVLEAAVEEGRGSSVEDELDAYICAYVAVYHGRWHGQRSLVIGDVATGYIVTPADAAADAALRAACARHGVRVA